MTQIIYTALRELTGATQANQLASLDVGISDYASSRSVEKDVKRAKGGAREILYHRADVIHNITFEPVNGYRLKQLQEFLASTESGESFKIFLYGTEALPVTVYRSDDGAALEPFMPVGTSDQDYWRASISVTEV